MRFWAAVVFANGMLINVQFFFPEFFGLMRESLAGLGSIDRWRPSGLFENANSAALYQVMGLVPLVLSGLPRRVTAALGAPTLFSIVATGSLAATSGLVAGTFAGVAGAVIVGADPGLVRRLLKEVTVAGALVGLLGLVVAFNADLSARFAYTFYGRLEGSAEGRFSLWERAAEVFGTDVPPWGIGPDSYRDLDVLRKPLHNDLLAFAIERGWLGLAGLILLGGWALGGALRLVRTRPEHGSEAGLKLAIFLAVITAATVHAQFHQIFHDRAVWLVLAAQQALLTRFAHQAAGVAKALAGRPALNRRVRTWSRSS
jgi:O-antigen ligase